MSKLKIGFLGSGSMAKVMAETMTNIENIEITAAASANPLKCQQFAEQFKIPNVYRTWEDLVKEADVDVIYIATPHSLHFAQALLALENSKHVFCEKPLTTEKKLAKKLFKKAKENHLFIGEAFWTRFNPVALKMKKLIEEKQYGNVLSISSDYGGYGLEHPRLVQKELAGGALLDIGVYGLNLAFMMLGADYLTLDSQAHIGDTGVDYQHMILLKYPDGTLVSCHHTIESVSLNQAVCVCETGYFVVHDIAKFKKVEVYSNEHQLLESFELDKDKTGYEYEIWELIAAIKRGANEFSAFPHGETLTIMKTIEDIHGIWYKGEN